MVGTGVVDASVRWAGADDVDELVRLRRLMFESMGVEVTDDIDAATAVGLSAGLASGDFFAAVVDDAAVPGRLAAGGIGMVLRRVPGPGSLDGTSGYIGSMVTDHGHRRKGHARLVLAALLDEFEARGIGKVSLHATEFGAPLYRSVGFDTPPNPELVRSR